MAASCPRPPARAYEPVLLGWVSSRPVLGDHVAALVTDNGLFRLFALVDGRAVATWRLAAGRVTLDQTDRDALDADAEAVAAFLGRP